VTLAMIDRVHQKAPTASRYNFNMNRKHFVDGVDYFSTTISELKKQLKINSLDNTTNWQIPNAGRSLTLLTERGYFKLATTFEDDLSWKIRDELKRTYSASFGGVYTGCVGSEYIFSCA
jgi:hypothetical protein